MSYKSLDQAVSRIEELEKKLDTLRRNLIDSSILVGKQTHPTRFGGRGANRR